MLQDLRFALRLLNRQRGYAAVAILTFALGVGANAAIFSVADSVLFRPLPFADASRLFVLRLADVATGEVGGTLPAVDVEAARATGMFDGIAGASYRVSRAYIRTSAGLEAMGLSPVSHQFLALLGVRPAVGRSFDASDAGTHAVVLTYKAWMKWYGGDPGVVGTAVPAIFRSTERAPASQPPVRIVGVLPPRLHLPLVSGPDGIVLDDEDSSGGTRVFAPLVRLAPGVSVSGAAARLRAIPLAGGTQSTLRLVPLREDMASQQDPVLWLLLGAAGIVLLATCFNLANLTTARGTARGRELTIRAALGGSRSRLVRLLLVEAVALAMIGTGVALLIGAVGIRMLGAALPPSLAAVAQPDFDARVIAFAVVTSAVTAALFSVAPAVRLTRTKARMWVGASLHGPAAARGARLLVAAECALCVALVAGAVLLGRTLATLVSQDIGFGAHRLAVTFDLPTMVVERDGTLRSDTAARIAFYRARLRDAREVPGVRAAALASGIPFSGMAPDAPLFDERGPLTGGVYSISSGYFASMGIALLAGRDLTDEESFGNAAVAVLNLTAARRLCGTPEACIGRAVPSPGQPVRRVVGVVADSRPSLRRPAIASMYVPFLSPFSYKTLVMWPADGIATVSRVRQALSVSKDARVSVQPVDEAVSQELSPYRFNAIVTGGFAVLTLLLAIVGVYGVMSAMVGQRTREYGVRLALGATRARVNRHVLGIAAVPIAWGIATGVLGAVWAVRYIGSLLYGVVPLDPVSFAGAAAVLLVSGLAAALIPATRAARVDPIVALRAE